MNPITTTPSTLGNSHHASSQEEASSFSKKSPCTVSTKATARAVDMPEPAHKVLGQWKITHSCDYHHKTTASALTSATGAHELGFAGTSELPISFIWFGSVIPDVYLKNISLWADKYPDRLHVLWINTRLLSHKESMCYENFYRRMPKNVLLADISESPTLKSQGFESLNSWIFEEIHKMSSKQRGRCSCLASDLYRLAILYYGSDLLREVSHDFSKLIPKHSTGMIYFDTDTYLEKVVGVKDMNFSGVLFSHQRNDVFAVSEAKHDFFKCYLDDVIGRFYTKMKEYKALDVIDTDTKMLYLSGFMSFSEIIDNHFGTVNKVEFPFEKQVHLSDCSWCDGKAFEMDRTILIA